MMKIDNLYDDGAGGGCLAAGSGAPDGVLREQTRSAVALARDVKS